jgi:hypothetical protein
MGGVRPCGPAACDTRLPYGQQQPRQASVQRCARQRLPRRACCAASASSEAAAGAAPRKRVRLTQAQPAEDRKVCIDQLPSFLHVLSGNVLLMSCWAVCGEYAPGVCMSG